MRHRAFIQNDDFAFSCTLSGKQWDDLSVALNAECEVQPPSNNVAAISEDATANAIWDFDQIVARINEIENVLPVPLGASRK